MIKFVLNGCDISFLAEAPEDVSLKQLLKQCDRIRPYYCACGICSVKSNASPYIESDETELIFSYDDVRKADKEVSCKILPITEVN